MLKLEAAWNVLAKRIALLHPLLAWFVLSTPAALFAVFAQVRLGHLFLWLMVTIWGGWMTAIHTVAIRAAPSTAWRLDRWVAAIGAVGRAASCLGLVGTEVGGDDGLAFFPTAFGILGWIVAGIAWFAIYFFAAFAFEKADATLAGRPPSYGQWTAYRVFPPPLAVICESTDIRRIASSA